MFEETALVAVAPPSEPEWRPIFHVSNQVVLYNPTSHALSIRRSSPDQVRSSLCPYCNRPLPADEEQDPHDRVSNYFQLLEVSNETYSRASTPPPISESSNEGNSTTFPAETMAQGYFNAFFQEECRLGMGANGSVHLCQHVLDGNRLGHFAVKKIAVGESHSYLWNILREVRLLESLHHPNIITYHHSWLEYCQFSPFGPKVPTLFVLMQWAEGGSLDDFIDVRLGRSTKFPHLCNSDEQWSDPNQSNPPLSDEIRSRSARIRAFKAQQRDRKEYNNPWVNRSSPLLMKAVHLLSAEEVKSLFKDVTEGLAFLHEKSILHLDLKPGNVLLTWDHGKLIPRAMLSDFGTSQDMLNSRTRSGNTGTLEYASPESLPSPHTGLLSQVDSKSDMWSLGMILHKIMFFNLPYTYASDGDGGSAQGERDKMERLEKEVQHYPGFKSSVELESKLKARRLPRNYLVLLESLLHVSPLSRPSCERVLGGIREGKLDPSSPDPNSEQPTSLVPISFRTKVKQPLTPASSPSRKFEERDSNDDSRPGVWSWSVTLARGKVVRILIPEVVVMRSVKSLFLVTKVFTMSSICPAGHNLRPIVLVPLLGLAVIDTWFDGLRVSVVLGVAHFLVLRLVSAFYECCS